MTTPTTGLLRPASFLFRAAALFLLCVLCLLPLMAGSHDTVLQNIQDDVAVRAAQFIDTKFEAGPPAVVAGLGGARQAWEYALAALYKNPDPSTVAAANALIITTLDVTCFTPTPGKTRTYFEFPMVLEAWYLFNSSTGVFPGRLTTGTGGSQQALKQWFYDQLSTFGAIDADDADLSELWTIHDSENHDLIQKAAVYLMANALRNDSAYKNLYVQDGVTTVEETWPELGA